MTVCWLASIYPAFLPSTPLPHPLLRCLHPLLRCLHLLITPTPPYFSGASLLPPPPPPHFPPIPQVAILGIKAAGVGLTLTAASLVLFAELSWVPGDILQVRGGEGGRGEWAGGACCT